MVFTNSATETYYRDYAHSFTKISVLMGYEMTNAYVAIVTIKTKASPTPDVLPFFFVKSNGSYFLSSYTFLSPREQNIGVFLNSHSAGDLIR